jgi:hypothetical protein
MLQSPPKFENPSNLPPKSPQSLRNPHKICKIFSMPPQPSQVLSKSFKFLLKTKNETEIKKTNKSKTMKNYNPGYIYSIVWDFEFFVIFFVFLIFLVFAIIEQAGGSIFFLTAADRPTALAELNLRSADRPIG